MKPKIAIIGGGTAGLSFASSINSDRYSVTLFEKKKRLGSKLLVAGKGGFNLTHSEPISKMIDRYLPASFLKSALLYFDNDSLISFFEKIGIETYQGSSGRIFPVKPTKPIEVVKAIENHLHLNQINLVFNTKCIDFHKAEKKVSISLLDSERSFEMEFDFVIFALGGASWPVTGSDGSWINLMKNKSIKTVPFSPSNCAVKVNWPENLTDLISGTPLKNISVSLEDFKMSGEIMLTDFGLEGTPIYALSHLFKRIINKGVNPVLKVDFKPNVTHETLIDKLDLSQPEKSWTNHVKEKLNLSKTQLRLIKTYISKEDFTNSHKLINAVKSFHIEITGLSEIEPAISTTGGIGLESVNDHFEFKQIENVFAIGEMLDWDAPTGGYLIQGCMSMGQYLANYFNQLK